MGERRGGRKVSEGGRERRDGRREEPKGRSEQDPHGKNFVNFGLSYFIFQNSYFPPVLWGCGIKPPSVGGFRRAWMDHSACQTRNLGIWHDRTSKIAVCSVA